MIDSGWIKLHRKLLNNPLWIDSTAEQKVILITLILMANHEKQKWIFNGEKFECKPGQFITSLKSIQEKAGKDISIMQIRRSLTKFEKYDFLTNEPTNKNRLITIVNWEAYQEKENKPTNKPTSNRQATDKQPTPNKNVRNKEYINNNIYTANSEHEECALDDICERIWTAYPLKKGKIHAIKAIKKLLQKNTEQELLNAIVSYKSDVEKQRKSGFKELRYKNGDTFFRSGVHDYLGRGENDELGRENKSSQGETSSKWDKYDFGDSDL